MKRNLSTQAFLKKRLMGYPVWRHVLYGVLFILLTLGLLVLSLQIGHWLKRGEAGGETLPVLPAASDELLAGIPETAFRREDVLVVGVDDPMAEINPLYASGDGELAAVDLIFEPLLRISADGQPLPVLALDWSYSPEDRKLLFNLRPDHAFQDGRVVSTQDVVFTYRCLLDASYDGPLRGRLAEILAVEAGSSPGQVVFTLANWVEEPDFRPFSIGILKSDAYLLPDGQVYQLKNSGAAPQGSGSFMLSQMSGSELVLNRRPGYGGLIREVTLRLIASEEKYALLLKGELDIVRNAWDKRMQLRVDDLAGYSFFPISSSAAAYLLLNPDPLPSGLIQQPSQRLAILLTLAGKPLSRLQEDSLRKMASYRLSLYYFRGIDDTVAAENQEQAQRWASQLEKTGLQVTIQAEDWPGLMQRATGGDYDLLLLPATANSRLPENAVLYEEPARPEASALVLEYRSEVFIVCNRLAQYSINPAAHPYAALAASWTDRLENIRVYNPDGSYWEADQP